VLAVVSFVSLASSKRFVSASSVVSSVVTNKPACISLVELCGASACNEVHCKQYHDFECCVTFEKTFCIQHDRLVDCFKCGVRRLVHACGLTHSCPWCSRPCYEDCMCAEFIQNRKSPKLPRLQNRKARSTTRWWQSFDFDTSKLLGYGNGQASAESAGW